MNRPSLNLNINVDRENRGKLRHMRKVYIAYCYGNESIYLCGVFKNIGTANRANKEYQKRYPKYTNSITEQIEIDSKQLNHDFSVIFAILKDTNGNIIPQRLSTVIDPPLMTIKRTAHINQVISIHKERIIGLYKDPIATLSSIKYKFQHFMLNRD